MTTWEYCKILWKAALISPEERVSIEKDPSWKILTMGNQTMASQGVLRFCSSSDHPETFNSLCDKLAELGSDGWEVIAHTYVVEPVSGESFLLKRPLAADHRY
jgi:hypothetical protein